jgi:hypothetical protein
MQYRLKSMDVTIEPVVAFDRKFLAIAISGETNVIPAESLFYELFVLEALTFAPQTTAEVFHFVTERLKAPMTRSCTYSTLWLLAKKGVIEKREEKDSHLDKWFLVAKN